MARAPEMAQSLKVASLSAMPIPFLSLLLSSTHSSFLLIPLWKCGNASFNQSLSLAATSLDLKDTNPFSTSRWPFIISRLSRLRSLRISRPKGFLLPDYEALLAELRKLPASVQRISINSNDIFLDLSLPNDILLADHLPASLASQANLNELNALFQEPHASQSQNPSNIHLAAPCSLTREAITQLPRSLTRLTGNFRIDEGIDEGGEKGEGPIDATKTTSPALLPWPPGLSSLEPLPIYLSTRQIHLLPSSLTTLVAHGLPHKESHFPPSLTCLELSYPPQVLISLPRSFPPTLTELKLGYVSHHTLQRLPLTLRTLSILIHRSDFVDASLDFSNIGLSSLTINAWDWKWTNKLPCSLTAFSAHRLSSFASRPSDDAYRLCGMLPQGLTSLTIGGGKCDLKPSSFDIRPLLHLRHLSMDGKLILSSAILRNLPKELRTLEIRLKSVKKQDAPFLPQNATHLALNGLRKLKSISILENWPLQAELPLLWRSKKNLRFLEKRVSKALLRARLCPDPRISPQSTSRALEKGHSGC